MATGYDGIYDNDRLDNCEVVDLSESLWKSAELVIKMDADNRVVLNCGGIRHEVYKVWSIHLLEADNLGASM